MSGRHAPRVAALAIALTIAAVIVSAARAGGERRLEVPPRASADCVSDCGGRDLVFPRKVGASDPGTSKPSGFQYVGLGQLGIDVPLSGRALSEYGPRTTDVAPRLAADDVTNYGLSDSEPTGNVRLTLASRDGVSHCNDLRVGKPRPCVALAPHRFRGAALGKHVARVVRISSKPKVRRVAAGPVVTRVANVKTAGIWPVDKNERKPMSEPGPAIDAHAPVAVTLADVPAPLPTIAAGAKAGRLVDPIPELGAQTGNGSRGDRDIIGLHREPPTLGAAGRDVSASPAIRVSIDTKDYTIRTVENVLASVTLRSVSGAILCRAAPMFDGIVTARHCIDNGAVHIDDGTSPPHSVDPTRDLAHIKALANPAVVMRPAVVGERLRWRSDFGAGDVTVTWTRGAVVAFAHGSGTRLSWGCSGTGLYGDDGALVAVLSDLYHSGDGHRIGRLIGGGESVQVP